MYFIQKISKYDTNLLYKRNKLQSRNKSDYASLPIPKTIKFQ